MTTPAKPSLPPRIPPNEQKLLWTSVARATLPCNHNHNSSSSSNSAHINTSSTHFKDAPVIILAEAGDDPFGGAVAQTARELLQKKATAGWEYHTQKSPLAAAKGPFWNKRVSEPQGPARLKGIKFHLYDNSNACLNTNNGDMLMWVFSVVYNPQAMDQVAAKSFIEKMIVLTELYRDTDEEWRTGTTLSCQASFAPILQQRMQEVSYIQDYNNNEKLRHVQERLEMTKSAMQDNIQLILQREEQLNDLNDRTTRLQDMAHDFQRKSRGVRQKMMWQNAKHGVILGSAVTATVAIIVVPPLVALL